MDEVSQLVNMTSCSCNNPNLNPLESDQADLSLEYYFNDAGGMAYVNLFYKDIDGIVRNQTGIEQYVDLNGQMQDYTLNRPVNVGSAKIMSYEVGYDRCIDFLPNPFHDKG